MHLDDGDSDLLKTWTVKQLEDVYVMPMSQTSLDRGTNKLHRSDADPDVLADYVLALVKSDESDEQVKQNCLENLEDFLKDRMAPRKITLHAPMNADGEQIPYPLSIKFSPRSRTGHTIRNKLPSAPLHPLRKALLLPFQAVRDTTFSNKDSRQVNLSRRRSSVAFRTKMEGTDTTDRDTAEDVVAEVTDR